MNIDDNRTIVGLAYNNTITTPLKVDSSTGRLLIDVVAVTTSTPTLNTHTSDENRSRLSKVSDGTNAKNLLIDSRNGYLWLDLVVE